MVGAIGMSLVGPASQTQDAAAPRHENRQKGGLLFASDPVDVRLSEAR
jgi:hypothetical protein